MADLFNPLIGDAGVSQAKARKRRRDQIKKLIKQGKLKRARKEARELGLGGLVQQAQRQLDRQEDRPARASGANGGSPSSPPPPASPSGGGGSSSSGTDKKQRKPRTDEKAKAKKPKKPKLSESDKRLREQLAEAREPVRGKRAELQTLRDRIEAGRYTKNLIIDSDTGEKISPLEADRRAAKKLTAELKPFRTVRKKAAKADLIPAKPEKPKDKPTTPSTPKPPSGGGVTVGSIDPITGQRIPAPFAALEKLDASLKDTATTKPPKVKKPKKPPKPEDKRRKPKKPRK